MADAPPPSRYSIYERDRRLVVVDNWAEGGPAPVNATLTPKAVDSSPGKMLQVAFDGRSTFKTLALFDAKGPRTLMLDPGSAATIERLKLVAAIVIAVLVFVGVTAPYLLLLPLLLLQRTPRERIRGAITAWLDRAGQPVA